MWIFRMKSADSEPLKSIRGPGDGTLDVPQSKITGEAESVSGKSEAGPVP